MSPLKKAIPILALIAGFSATLLSVSVNAEAQDRADTLRTCINGLLYRRVFSNGNPNGFSRTDVSEALAGQACQGVSTPEAAQAQSVCENGLLYQLIFDDGTPNGMSRNEDITADLAVRACDEVNTLELAQEQRICVNGLVYRRIFADGRPNGMTRTSLQTSTAIDSCVLPETTVAEVDATPTSEAGTNTEAETNAEANP